MAGVALPYRIALLVAVSAGLGVPLSVHERDVRDERLTARFAAVAADLVDPADLQPLTPRRDCGGPSVVRCGLSPSPDVERLASDAQQAVSRASGEDAVLRCDDVPGGGLVGRPALVRVPRSCAVSVTELGHGVSVWIDTQMDWSSGTPRLVGSQYRVDAW